MTSILIVICLVLIIAFIYYKYYRGSEQNKEPLFKGVWHMLDDQLDEFGVNTFILSAEKGFIYIEDANGRVVLDREFIIEGSDDSYILCNCFCPRFKTEYIDKRCYIYNQDDDCVAILN